MGGSLRVFSFFSLLIILLSTPVLAFDRIELMKKFKVLEKELKLLAKEQYAHESVESDKVINSPGYVPNNLMPEIKSAISDVVAKIIEFRSSALSNPKDSQNCRLALEKYTKVSLPAFKAAYIEFKENKSTLFVGVQGIVMANSLDGAAFISGPAFECSE